jgi:hypothetical protein
MTDTESTFAKCGEILESLNTLPWCKQGDAVLVAVHTCTEDVLSLIKDHEVKVFPGNVAIKLNRSTIHTFQQKCEAGEPIPVLFVWKPNALEIWFRTHKSTEFPYDAWSDPAAAAYERECAVIPAEHFGSKYAQYHRQHIDSAKACPSTIPPL